MHSNRESYQLCHRLTRYLVEQHGFGAYAMESGFVAGWPADDWVSGGQGRPGHVLARCMTSLMGPWTEMRGPLEWMRQHNLDAARPVGSYGIDLSGSNISPLPGLDEMPKAPAVTSIDRLGANTVRVTWKPAADQPDQVL
ncbi:erythromycin esterase family protein [Streptomyces caniferus]|uniref:erythromycin esterase family protein n=1 Tax=Streptomyces caniferus TaxID=285557 RepID=UPI0034005C19